MVHEILQLYSDDCGFTCLKMLLANLKKDRWYLYLKHPKNSGTYSFFELKEIAKRYDVHLSGYKFLNDDDLLSISKFPFIANVKNGQVGHALFVYKLNKKYIYYVDPNHGKEKMKLSDFYKIWDHSCLIYDYFKLDDHKRKMKRFIDKRDRQIQICLNSLVSLSFFAFIFVVSPSIPFYLPFLILMSFVIFEIIYRNFSLKLSKKFDEEYLADYLYKSQNEIEGLKTMTNIKTFAINAPIIFLTNILTIVLLLVLASLTSTIFIYLFSILLLVHIFFFLFEKQFVEGKKRKIIEKEAHLQFIKQLDFTSFKKYIDGLTKDSEEVAKIYLMKKYIIWFIVAMLAIFITMALGTFNFGQLLFSYILLFYASETMIKMFSYAKEYRQYQKAYMTFMNVSVSEEENYAKIEEHEY